MHRQIENQDKSDSRPEVLLLLSGGLDSSACMKFYIDLQMPIEALFVDYGQLAADQELKAARRICDDFGVCLRETTWRGHSNKPTGLIQGRNAFLVTAALMEAPDSVRTIALGIHGGTGYQDCSADFVERIGAVINTYEGPRIDLGVPFLEWNKGEVYAYARTNAVPIDLTYSCEAGSPEACGNCQSCIDRQSVALHAK